MTMYAAAPRGDFCWDVVVDEWSNQFARWEKNYDTVLYDNFRQALENALQRSDDERDTAYEVVTFDEDLALTSYYRVVATCGVLYSMLDVDPGTDEQFAEIEAKYKEENYE